MRRIEGGENFVIGCFMGLCISSSGIEWNGIFQSLSLCFVMDGCGMCEIGFG